jgi:hypothetical protein
MRKAPLLPLFLALGTRGMAITSGPQMLALQRWAVVGDALNENKAAFRIAERLTMNGKKVLIHCSSMSHCFSFKSGIIMLAGVDC